MARPKKIQPPLKPKPKTQRPRCLQCEHRLEPQFIEYPLPANLADGRRAAQREQWEKEHPPRFTGIYGRAGRFCSVTCGYTYAVEHTRPAK